VSGSWGLWLDLWSTALRHPEVREARVELDSRWRDLVERIVSEGQASGTVDAGIDARQFALTFTVLLDGLSTQVALGDEEITSAAASGIAMEYAEQRLRLVVGEGRPRRARKR